MSVVATLAEWEDFVALTLSSSGSSLSAPEAARLMQLELDEVLQMVADDRLLGVPHEGRLRIPTAQLTLKAEPDRMEVIDGVVDVLSLFASRHSSGAHVYALEYLIQNSPALGTAPITALGNGRKEAVIDLTRHLFGLDET